MGVGERDIDEKNLDKKNRIFLLEDENIEYRECG
jgi:hypothetical protein